VRRASTWVVAVLAAVAPAVGRAQPEPPAPPAPEAGASRVLIADGDPELARATERSLAPWRLVVVVDPEIPDESQAHARAERADARFIVWRDRDELVVFDRDVGTTERRPGRAGAFDAVSAAAAALTVKTMMRLPPEPGAGDATTGVETTVPPPVAPPDDGTEVRVQAGVGGRLARGSQTDVDGRVALAVFLRPSTAYHLRIGLAAELGTRSGVTGSGFHGDWSDAAMVGLIAYSFARGRLELEPMVGGGAARISFDGVEMQTTRRERSLVGVLRGGMTVRWPLGIWSLGAYIAVDANLGTPTYTRVNNGGNANTIFAVPSFTVGIGMLAAIDFGR
jgi:hypothetical protein